jgi:hypothetical protein
VADDGVLHRIRQLALKLLEEGEGDLLGRNPRQLDVLDEGGLGRQGQDALATLELVGLEDLARSDQAIDSQQLDDLRAI